MGLVGLVAAAQGALRSVEHRTASPEVHGNVTTLGSCQHRHHRAASGRGVRYVQGEGGRDREIFLSTLTFRSHINMTLY